MLDNSLTKLFEIRLSAIDEYLLSIKPEFVEKFGLDLWKEIVKRNGIPHVLKYHDDAFYYMSEDKNMNIKKRFNAKTWLSEFMFPSDITIENFKRHFSSAYIANKIIYTEKYKWVMGVKEILPSGDIVADYIHFD